MKHTFNIIINYSNTDLLYGTLIVPIGTENVILLKLADCKFGIIIKMIDAGTAPFIGAIWE